MPTPAEFSIEGKVFVAVGAGGAASAARGIVEVFAEAGADGAVVALTPAYVRPLAERLGNQTGRRIDGIAADGTSTAAVEQVVAQVLRDFGRIDISVNALGDSIRSPIRAAPPAGRRAGDGRAAVGRRPAARARHQPHLDGRRLPGDRRRTSSRAAGDA